MGEQPNAYSSLFTVNSYLSAMPLPKISLDNVSSAYFRSGLGAVKEAGAP